MADRAIRLCELEWHQWLCRIEGKHTLDSMAVSRYCLIHSRSNMWWHFDWIASSAMSLQIRQTVASPSSGMNFDALVLLRMTRSGWHAICRMRVKLRAKKQRHEMNHDDVDRNLELTD
jgi:hypothetical protein